jgi:hypothetical protein
MIEPKWMARLLPAVALALCAPAGVAAYPGGTPYFVTDVAPYCTSCHSSVSASQFTGVPEQRVQAELADAKHLAKIRGAAEGSPYAKLSAEQRATLLEDVQKIDDASSISLAVPPTLGVGQKFEVTVTAIGGGGPVVGIALVDSNQRWQARPATSAGFAVLDTPSVRDPDGKPQTRFTDARNPALAPGISYVNVYGVNATPSQGKFSTVAVTFQMRAPLEPGTYTLGAAFFYGTEKGSRHGAVETIRGKQPLGGFGANSGRVRFSDIARIKVE